MDIDVDLTNERLAKEMKTEKEKEFHEKIERKNENK
jgi:hypothetical protein